MSTVRDDQLMEELRRELADAREQQAATAEILKGISSSPTGFQRVFTVVAASAARLCDAFNATIYQVDGDLLHPVAHYGPISAPGTLPLTRRLLTGRAVLDRTTIHVADLHSEVAEYPDGSELARRFGFRTNLAIPLIRTGEAVGAIAIRRTEVRPFTDRQVELLKIFADQAVIAIENTRLFEAEQTRTRELTESLEYQTATSEVLAVISKSPNDLQPVLDAIVATAQRLCQAEYTLFAKREGDGFYHIKAGVCADRAFLEWVRSRPTAAGDGNMVGLVACDRQTLHFPDCLAQPRFTDLERQQQSKVRTMLGVPLLRAGEAIGVIFLARTIVQPFTDRQIALVTTFADQAVIAIENTRLFEELQTRTRELSNALDYQTATSDVLNAFSRSKFDLQPVLDTIAQSAARLCGGLMGGVFRYDGELQHLGAMANFASGEDTWRRTYPRPATRDTATGRAILDKAVVVVPDVETDTRAEWARALARTGGYRSVLAVPMLREDDAIGAILVARTEPGSFADAHVEILKTFADQAVIAIENTRLFEAEQASKRELQVSLEYQTAISEVLGVIGRSPSQLQPVLDTIVATASRLCRAEYAGAYKLRDGFYHLSAANNAEAAFTKYTAEHPIAPGRGSLVGRTALAGKTVHILDCLADPEYTFRENQRIGKFRSMLGVPLLRDGKSLGVMALVRTIVQAFTDKEIELVSTFADQAVIAIENTRLFEEVQARTRELTESLQQQTGTAEVLKVISRSAFDLQSVLQALVESAARLCDADKGVITRQIDGVFYRAESYGFPAEVIERWRNLSVTAERGSAAGRALLEGRTVHVPDADADPDYTFDKAGVRRGSILGVPMLREGVPIGVLALARSDVRPFTDKQIDLVSTFADQAAIAIENVRLFEEVQARTSELAKTVEDLEIASQHKSQFVANMSHELRTPLAAILGYAELMQEGFYEAQGPKSLDALTRIRSNGKHLLGLINAVLDIAKIEAGQFTLNMAEYAIESVVETVRSATESLAQNKKLALTTEVPKSLPTGLGDEQRLTQVLLNLVGNAIKFTDKGEVRVTVKAINGHFNVSVIDTGPGIPVEHQARIFEQFHQVDSSNTKAKGGTGLGLTIAKQIIEMHGGRIWVESTIGKGSTFQMELPTRAEFRKRPA